jgi:hypothetical protein
MCVTRCVHILHTSRFPSPPALKPPTYSPSIHLLPPPPKHQPQPPSPAGATDHPFFPLLALIVVAWDTVAVYCAWRHFVAGPRFMRVEMRGKVCVVTGANTGIGRETARFLAEMGAQVVMGA